jgi:hypothetical protein
VSPVLDQERVNALFGRKLKLAPKVLKKDFSNSSLLNRNGFKLNIDRSKSQIQADSKSTNAPSTINFGT